MARKPSPKKRVLNALDQFAPIISRELRAAIRDLRDGVQLRALAEALERGDIPGAIAATNLDEAAFIRVQQVLEDAFTSGGRLAVEQLPKTPASGGAAIVVRFDVRNPRAERYLREASSRLVTNIIEDTRLMLRNTLSDALAVGRGPMAIALDIAGRVNKTTRRRTGGFLGMTEQQAATVRGVRAKLATGDTAVMSEYFKLKKRNKNLDHIVRRAIREKRPVNVENINVIAGKLSDNYILLRAETVARTETLRAVNAGRHEGFRQGFDKLGYSPDAVIRRWDNAGDGKVRETHIDIKPVRGLDEPFVTNLGSRMMHPGDTTLGAGAEDVINCRCIETIRVDVFGERNG